MTITCPHCGFSRQLEAARIPARPARAICPRCRQAFTFAPDAAEAPPALPAGEEAKSVVATTARPAEAPLAAAEKAGFWIRAVAASLDMLAVGLLESVLGSLLVRIGGIEPALTSPEGRLLTMVVAAFGMVLGYAYRVFFIGHCGQTPGKMAVRIKVVRTDGTELDYTRALLREVVGKFLSKIILGIGYLMVAFDARKQGLHDKIADTYVIRL